MTAEPSRRNPYPGPRPFERGEQNLFFGRDREVADLLSLIIAHREVLLYAQSGAGKTSLLNAGVVPLLSQEEFEVLPVARVRGLIPEGIEPKGIRNIYVFNTLMGWEVDKVDPRSMMSTSIPAFLRERGHPTGEEGLPSPSVAIFDQFEELFGFYSERWAEREEFFLQIAEALEADPLLRVLFVIREDYLASLDPYADLLPEGLRTCYRLERLRRDAARMAVEGPLRGTGRAFAEGVVSALVQELVGIRVESTAGEMVEAAGEYVEPVQLQVVCQNLWLELPPETTLITANHLRTFGDVNEALKAFYERAIKRVAEETAVSEGDLRNWFDQQLITAAGTRGTVYRGRESTGGIPNAAVDAMENQHLIRAELRAGGRWYELTHDRFIDPIQKSNDAWRLHERTEAQQRQIEAARQRAEEQERRAEEQTKEARRLWRLSAALVLVSLLAVGAAGLAVWGWKAADAERDRAEKARAEAVDAQKKAEAERQRAEQKTRLATARELAAAAIDNLTRDPERSVLLAMQAVSETYTVDKTVTPEAEDALHRAVQAARVQLTLSGHNGMVTSLAFSPDGTRLATASWDKTAKVWDVTTGEVLLTLSGHTAMVSKVAFSPDGSRLATAGSDHTAKVWDAITGKELFSLGHAFGVMGLAFSPDGTRLATASKDQTATVWDALTGRKVRTFAGHTNVVPGVAFSPDGTRLATASWDKTAKVWDAATGNLLLTLAGHTGPVQDLAFSPDGTHLATMSFEVTMSVDGSARVYTLGIQELMALARRRVTRTLTASECQRYLHQEQCPPMVTALGLVVAGRSRARVGDLDGAVASLREAQRLEPTLEVDPEAEGKAMAVAGLLFKGKNQARAGDVEGATESLQKARGLNPAMALDPRAAAARWAASALIECGGRLVEQGKAKEALASYDEAQAVDPSLRVPPGSWNSLCWRGSLRGHAAEVMAACERAVTLVPEYGGIRESRGLARALMGDYAGAIEDFRFFVEWTPGNEFYQYKRSTRQAWITALEGGRNPFDAATLEALRLRE